MEYNYESLLAERFQMLCQALLVKTHPDVQCLPVGMPDAGRDAFSFTPGKELLIFQVKFARNPLKIHDPFAWLANVIDKERPKIADLARRGATRYFLLTNVQGTSHKDVGTIDRVQAYLNHLPIPSRCWWRDDLDRRLDNQFDLKLHYPSLLSGPDAIRLMWNSACAGEAQERRQNALIAYFKHQHNQDKTIRFKQAELLPTPLFDIFIDVPVQVSPKAIGVSGSSQREFQQALYRIMHARLGPDYDGPSEMEFATLGEEEGIWVRSGGALQRANVGAAELLLDPHFAANLPGIVLEGAPGQGKSTLAQFLVQVDRARILSESIAIPGVASVYTSSPLALPFKLELRDVAAWLNGINPWTPTSQNPQHNKPATLEGAIAGHIERYSGGIDFDVADLHRTIESSPIFLVLDALDEVADLDHRRRVVDEVQQALTRMQRPGNSIRLLVTSRPSAIANAPAFSREHFVHLTLAPINPPLALDYTDRWAEARRLDDKDKTELRDILQAKMNAPHMAELAKNTMQLSILLSLIHLRGSSLPDKRTELYDTYVDVFLNRESEKSKVVRDNRELLVDIHRYLGYYMHARAEASNSTGRINFDELRDVVSAYLTREGRQPELLDSLLTGMVERVVALVSRVEGTYEFEVQPLREYFAARHLYDTAPYSPTGRQRKGTKPDRFDGIARNPYWLNVTRFFAGCFSKGELLDLAERLCDQIHSKGDQFATYPRILAISLLQDWVFTQSPKATARAVEQAFDNFGLRWAAAQTSYLASPDRYSGDLTLAQGAGAEHLINVIWRHVINDVPTERRIDLCRLAAAQLAPKHRLNIWVKALNNEFRSVEDRARLLDIGRWWGVLPHLTREQLLKLLDPGDEKDLDVRLAVMARSGARMKLLPIHLQQRAVKAILGHPERAIIGPRNAFTIFAFLTDPYVWTTMTGDRRGHLYHFLAGTPEIVRTQSGRGSTKSGIGGVDEVVEIIVNELIGRRPPVEVGLWKSVVDTLHRHFGKSWTELEIGIISGALKLGRQDYQSTDNIFDYSVPLVDRVRNARKRAGHASWWKKQLLSASESIDYGFWMMAAYAWASPRALGELIDDFESSVKQLTARDYSSLWWACERASRYSPNARQALAGSISNRIEADNSIDIVALLFRRLSPASRTRLIAGRMGEQLAHPMVAESILRSITAELLTSGAQNATGRASLMAACHEAGAMSHEGFLNLAGSGVRKLGEPGAKAVLNDAWHMPTEAILSALRIVGRKMEHPRPVDVIAEEEGWFEDR